MTREFFNHQFSAMLLAYTYAQKAPEEAQDVYWELLKRIPEWRFHHAVKSCLEACKFFPTIAELLEAAKVAPQPRLKLLDEPRPSEDEIVRGQELLRETVKSLVGKFDICKAHAK